MGGSRWRSRASHARPPGAQAHRLSARGRGADPWRLDAGEDSQLLQFRDDGTYLQGPHPQPSTPYRERYRYRLHRDVLSTQSEGGCSRMRIRFSGRRLELSAHGDEWQTLEPASREEARALAALPPTKVKLTVREDGTVVIGAHHVDDPQLVELVRPVLAREPDTPFELGHTPGTPKARLEEVAKALKQAGAKTLVVRER